MREALGPDMDIMIDINQGYNADVAINQGRKIVDYDIYWLEEPVPADDFKGYVRVAQALPIRIVGGETHFTRFDLRPFFENPCCPILQPDPMRGGFTDLRKISVLADTWNIAMAPHLFPELNVQLLASIPNGIWIEDMGLSEDLFVDPVPIVNGMITAPERPGHGLAFKPEILKRLQSVVTSERDPALSAEESDGALRAGHRHLRPQQAAGRSDRRSRPERTLLFVHGSTYPAHTGFDLPLGGQSWMEYIASRGYDVYCLDVRGYGRSTRPKQMSEPAQNNPPIARTPDAVKDITAVLNAILKRRNIPRLNLLGWSWGCTLMATTAIQNPGKVARLMLYAPGWLRTTPSLLNPGGGPLGAYRTVTREQAKARWLNGVPEAKQAALIPPGWFEQWADATWATDPEGAKQSRRWSARRTAPWRTPRNTGPPARRCTTRRKSRCRRLIAIGEWDRDTPPYMAQAIFPLLINSPGKRLVMLAEGTHHMMLEKNRLRAVQGRAGVFGRSRLREEAMMLKALLALFVTLAIATGAAAQAQLVTEEMMVKSSDAGIEIFVRNKRPANMTSFRPDRDRAVRPRRDLSGACRVRPPARRPVVDGVHRLARLRRLSARRPRLRQIDPAEGNGRGRARTIRRSCAARPP